MSASPATIADTVHAFDAVIPGYAWAWHDANAPTFQHRFGTPETGGWRDRRRKRLKFDRDRCLLVYGLAHGSAECPSNPDVSDADVILFNRGYLQLARVRLANSGRSLKDLMALGPHASARDWENRRATWFYDDSCAFAERTAITLSVLFYIHQHAVAVYPLWQNGDLTRSS